MAGPSCAVNATYFAQSVPVVSLSEPASEKPKIRSRGFAS